MTEPARAPTTIAVTSGKGGVGKSTIALNLALALAEGGTEVGLLDADFYGPDIPLMVNLKRTQPLERWMLGRARDGGRVPLEPVERYGIRIMSVGFLLAETQALTMAAPLLGSALRQLAVDVNWGPLGYLVVDLPPGTGDLQQQLFQIVPVTGALIVVGPQDVAHLDGKKVLAQLRDAGIRVLGGIENMSELRCPHCGEAVSVFPEVPEDRSLWAEGVPMLGKIPLQPAVAAAGDAGKPLLVAEPDASEAEAFRAVARAVVAELERLHA